jgi:hypothetical protein
MAPRCSDSRIERFGDPTRFPHIISDAHSHVHHDSKRIGIELSGRQLGTDVGSAASGETEVKRVYAYYRTIRDQAVQSLRQVDRNGVAV